MSPTEDRLASICGTRTMIAQDEFFALTQLLVTSGVVRADVMAGVFRMLAGHFDRKAAGEIETDRNVCPSEFRERAATLTAMADEMSSGAVRSSALR